MKKFAALCLAIFAVSTISVPAEAANRTTLLTNAFQKYLSDGELIYSKAMSDAAALYEPQISSSLSKLKDAQTQFALNNQVTILKTTSHSPSAPIGIDAVNCPATRTDCKDPSYKSNEFKAGEVATIYSLIGGDGAFTSSSWAQMNLGMLQTVDQEVKDGLISLNNATAYNNAASAIRSQYQNAVSFSQQYAAAKSAAESTREDVRGMAPMISSAVLSAKRANANPSKFEKAFVTSFKFEYNAKRLDELARAPWTYISSLKALSDAVSVTKQSAKADAISARYTDSAASSMNSTYGTLFLNEDAFRSGFQLVAGIYKSTTGISLSLK